MSEYSTDGSVEPFTRLLRKFIDTVAAASWVASFVASTVIISSGDALGQAASAQAPMMDDGGKAECALRLAEFVKELDKAFDTEHSVFPIQELFKKYFPVSACNIDRVFDIGRESRYFDGADNSQPDTFSVSFDNEPFHPYSKLYVQISFDRKSGNSEPPFVIIRSF